MAAGKYVSVTATGALGLKRIESWSVRETAGAVATVTLRTKDGSGTIVLSLYIPANGVFGDTVDWLHDDFHLTVDTGAVRFSAQGEG